MTTNNSLPLNALLKSIEIEGDVENGKQRTRSKYSLRLYVDNKEVAKSTHPKDHAFALKWEWDADNRILFQPLSKLRVVIHRGFGININLLNSLVVQYEEEVVKLLGNDASFVLKDKDGNPGPAKLMIRISPGLVDNAKGIMEKVDADVRRLSSNGAGKSAVLTVGMVLQLTKTILDNVTVAHPMLNATWSLVSCIYEAVQEIDLQDEAIQALAETLREILGITKKIPDLQEIQDTTNVIDEISTQSRELATLIGEYTHYSRLHRTFKIPLILKPRIEDCQKKWADLKDKLATRIAVKIITEVMKTGRDLKEIKDDQLAEKIHKWLSPPDSSKNYNEADEKRQVDTCTWLLKGKRFLEWKERPGFLWVKGKAGSGKSIISSSIIDNLKENETSFAVGYFFFDGRDSQSALQLHDKFIRSLISQFSHKRGGIPQELADLYKRCGDHQQPLVSQLQDTLRNILSGFFRAYIVIDALDECTDRNKTRDWVNELVTDTDRKLENLHIVVTSRPEPDIEEVFAALDRDSIDVGEATANQDITKYLELQLESKCKRFSETTRKKIESELREHAEGSFRWVALQLAELEKCSSEYQINHQLKNLPEGLDDIYKRILKGIDGKYRSDTLTFLQWLAFSMRPMRIEEVAEAITVEFDVEDGPVFIPTKRYMDPQDVRLRCLSLVNVESDRTIKLSHFSVKEYLLSPRVEKDFFVSEAISHSKISQVSVAYLLQFQSFEPLTKVILNSSPLALYAAEHWVNHAKSGGINQMDPALQKLILRLFTSGTAPLKNWTWMLAMVKDMSIGFDHFSSPFVDVHSPLYYASLFGLHNVLEHLLVEADVNAKEGKYGNALQAASYGGDEAMVKLLVEKDADVNAQGGKYGNALQAASYSGREAIVTLLLEKDANVNAQGGEFGNALQAASFRGHEAIVTLLLEKDADVNAQGGRYGNPLDAASQRGHHAIVKLLVEKGVDVNAQGGYYGNALQAALERGHEVIVKLLIEKDANVNAQGGYYGNALQAASERGHEVIVKLLIEKDANVNAQGGGYGNALQAASSSGHEAIVTLLLEKKANVNAQGGAFGNALQAASFGGHHATVMLLMGKGPDVNMQGGKYGNALHAASLRGNDVIVKLLLERGANVHAQGGEYGNALQAALSIGHEAIVTLLLEKGADVNAQGGKYGNALQMALCEGDEGIMKLLLEMGADVNAQGGKYGNALQAASLMGHEAIVNLLLWEGANVNAQGGEYGNALQAASSIGHEAIVTLLLEKGADVNAQGGYCGNALQAALSIGHEAIVTLLLEKGADVNVQGEDYGNALQMASCNSDEAIVKLLLEKGADVNAQGGKYSNALQAASFMGHEAIVNLLLGEGANVNAQGGPFGNALQVALYRRHHAIVMLLMGKRPDVNAQGGYCGNALQAASLRGNDVIVKLLLEKGVDVNVQGGEFGNALQAASFGGYEGIVKLLLEKDANVNAQGGKYSNALQAASERGHEAIIKLLVKKGVNVNVQKEITK